MISRSDDPFTFPNRDPYDWLVVNLSGGRSSAYLLQRILDAHGGGLPDRTVVLFANTGKERWETLDFVRDIERHWRVPIMWLEYVYRPNERPKHHYRLVNHQTASRNGEPFE